jgi:predicted nucleic acid-binding protein
MENRKILVDTSVIIDYLRNKNKQKSIFIKLFKEYDLCLSVITAFELFNGATTENKKNDIEILCKELEIIDFDFETAKLSSSIYLDLCKMNKLIEFRDILIGATAIQKNIQIATLNLKHFVRIKNIKILTIE